jgi:hypothetical protein
VHASVIVISGSMGCGKTTVLGEVSLGNFTLLLSGPGASGSRPMPDGQRQSAGGWNRIVLRVTDLPTVIEQLKKAGLKFRNEMETGPGGRQIQLEDPDGNPIELFEPARRQRRGSYPSEHETGPEIRMRERLFARMLRVVARPAE